MSGGFGATHPDEIAEMQARARGVPVAPGYGFPERTLASLIAYRDQGRPTGDFLRAVLSNDLVKAFAHADPSNAAAMHEIVRWVYNELPSDAWGDAGKVSAWIEMHADRRAVAS